MKVITRDNQLSKQGMPGAVFRAIIEGGVKE